MKMKQVIRVAGVMVVAVVLAPGVLAGSNLVLVPRTSNIDSRWQPPTDLGFVEDFRVTQTQVVARYADGSLRAWGPAGSTVPAAVSGVRSIHATYGNFFALYANGSVKTWMPGSIDASPFTPPGLGNVVQVDGNGSVVIALRADGSVWWDYQGSCLCGFPVPSDLSPCVRVAAGGNDAIGLALQTDGIVRWWGGQSDPTTQCGGSCADRRLPLQANGQPASLTFSSPVRELAGGQYGQVVLTQDGVIHSYGRLTMSCTAYASVDMRFPGQPYYGNLVCATVQGGIASPIGGGSDCGLPVSQGRVVQLRVLPESVGVIAAIEPFPDADGDGIIDSVDNCPTVYNPDQADCNHDGVGDACQPGFSDCNADGIPDYCTSGDCNSDGIRDVCEIAAGALDINHNGIPDSCECLGDILPDGRIDGADLGAVLSYWGPVTSSATSQACDIDKNGVVNGADLGLLLSNWGPCPS